MEDTTKLKVVELPEKKAKITKSTTFMLDDSTVLQQSDVHLLRYMVYLDTQYDSIVLQFKKVTEVKGIPLRTAKDAMKRLIAYGLVVQVRRLPRCAVYRVTLSKKQTRRLQQAKWNPFLP